MAIAFDNNAVLDVEQANFVMLSLYREYSKQLMKNKYNVFIEKQMQRIKHDMMYLDKKQMVTKARDIYAPILKEILK